MQKYIELKMLDQQIQEMQQNMQQLETQRTEIIAVQQALDELKNEKKGTEILVSVASGIFMKAVLSDSENLILNVGNGVAVEKNVEQTSEILERQRDEITKVEHEYSENIDGMIEKAMALQAEMQSSDECDDDSCGHDHNHHEESDED